MTAVEFIHEIAKQREPDKFDWEEAKKLEKQQMCDFFREGYMWCNSPSLHIHNGKVITSTVKYGELYYDRKFKKEKL